METDKMDQTDLCFTSAVQLARLIQSREISPVELMEAVLSRIERLKPKPTARIDAKHRYRTTLIEIARQAGSKNLEIDGIAGFFEDKRANGGKVWGAIRIDRRDGKV